MTEKKSLARRGMNTGCKGNLPEELTISLGMNMMITTNIKTDLGLANGSRGDIVGIVLHKEDEDISKEQAIVRLHNLPAFILVKLQKTKIPMLCNLPPACSPSHIRMPVLSSSSGLGWGNERWWEWVTASASCSISASCLAHKSQGEEGRSL